MKIFDLAEGLAKKMKWYDIAILKWSVLFFTLFLFTAWEGFRNVVMKVDWYWYLIIALIMTGYLTKKMFSKN